MDVEKLFGVYGGVIYLVFYLAYFLAFYLVYFLIFYLAYFLVLYMAYFLVWIFAVQVRQGTLGVDGRG